MSRSHPKTAPLCVLFPVWLGITSAVACCKDGDGRELRVDESGRRRGGRQQQQQQQQQQCGLCSLVARAFRRAVCGAPSRRGSGDSYQELTTPPPIEEEQIVQQEQKEQRIRDKKQQEQGQEKSVSSTLSYNIHYCICRTLSLRQYFVTKNDVPCTIQYTYNYIYICTVDVVTF